MTGPVEVFEAQRGYLFAIAYRMLGEVGEAEDAVQEAYLRWERAGFPADNARGYLGRVVSRLCIDQLRSARARRERYVGPWLPEPLVAAAAEAAPSPEADAVRAESVSTAFLLLLETLSPTERAVFLLRQVFDFSYADIAETLGKSEVACRQIFSRAQGRLAGAARFEASGEAHRRLVTAFATALASGQVEPLVELLAEDVVMYSDGGGKASAARVPLEGRDRVLRFLLGIVAKAPEGSTARFVTINGGLGVVTELDGEVTAAFSFAVRDGRIVQVQSMRNPDKLRHLAAGSRR